MRNITLNEKDHDIVVMALVSEQQQLWDKLAEKDYSDEYTVELVKELREVHKVFSKLNKLERVA